MLEVLVCYSGATRYRAKLNYPFSAICLQVSLFGCLQPYLTEQGKARGCFTNIVVNNWLLAEWEDFACWWSCIGWGLSKIFSLTDLMVNWLYNTLGDSYEFCFLLLILICLARGLRKFPSSRGWKNKLMVKPNYRIQPLSWSDNQIVSGNKTIHLHGQIEPKMFKTH